MQGLLPAIPGTRPRGILPRIEPRVFFADDRDISDPDVVADCLAGLVSDPAQVIAGAGADAVKQRLRESTDEAVRLGIFGAPTCTVDDELFRGNDRLEVAIEAARARARS